MKNDMLTRFMRDPRHGQLVAVGSLVLAGVIWFGFEVPWWRPLTALIVANAVQWLGSKAAGIRYDWRSPTITSLSLTLLLRTHGWELVALAAAIAIGSKFVLRLRGRHFWNPATLAIAVVTALYPGAWVSAGQWGISAWLAIFAIGAGLIITRKSGRAGVPFLFLATWAVLAFGRAWWLGDPISVPLHQMASGALIIFAFFMISDPMTQPWHMGARAAWVVGTACLGFWMQSAWIVTAGPIWGLALSAPLVPLLDHFFPAPRKHWVEDPVPAQPKGIAA